MAAPRTTYRLQIRRSFDLFAAAEICEYLAALGVDAVYLSPLLPSTAGSDHGYDVVAFDTVDEPRGGPAGWSHLLATARAHGLKVVVDIVPNHTGVEDASQNQAWWELLRLGRAAGTARWFDVDWSRGRILLPVLGDDAGPADLTVVDGELRYAEHRFPLAPGTADDGADPATVHDRQHYELVNYRRADTEQNYRRFFAVTTLAGLRVEEPEVFDATHVQIARWLHDDHIDGLRVDHPDGLADPPGYLRRLRELAGPDTWLVVEKILEPGETLPADWPVDGTTGYDALTEVTEALLGPIARSGMRHDYRLRTGDERTFADHAREGKTLIATTILRAEILRMARLAGEIEGADTALTELVVAFPVYRSYLPEGTEHLTATLAAVRAARPDLGEILDRLAPRLADPGDELAVRFQQATGAVMAKGVEDTAYYRDTACLVVNEVGGDPDPSGEIDFHDRAAVRLRTAPNGMTTLSTHDTKRGEDVRARLIALGESTGWSRVVSRLATTTPIPDPSFAALLWQTVVGAGFIARDRMHAYVEKAMREAARSTSWRDPDADFEAAVHAAVDAAYDDPAAHEPLAELIAGITPLGWAVSLAQKLIQLTMPGVPDVYQGTELWDDSLVDPDNRRPVDFTARAERLAALDAAATPPPVDRSGDAKLWVTSRALRLRRDRPELFTGYRPLGIDTDGGRGGPEEVRWERDACLLAFDRGGAVTVATRQPGLLGELGGWGESVLALDGTHRDVLTDRRYGPRPLLADVLATYPVALLVAED